MHNNCENKVGATEDGAYALNGSNSNVDINILRNVDANFFIPSEDEWYKAAYHDPTRTSERLYREDYRTSGIPSEVKSFPIKKPSQQYWNFAMRTDINDESLSNFGNTELKDVGSYEHTSYYGTYDQCGNIWEWTETTVYHSEFGPQRTVFPKENLLEIQHPKKCLRGGAFNNSFADISDGAYRGAAEPLHHFGLHPTEEGRRDGALGFQNSQLLLISRKIGTHHPLMTISTS